MLHARIPAEHNVRNSRAGVSRMLRPPAWPSQTAEHIRFMQINKACVFGLENAFYHLLFKIHPIQRMRWSWRDHMFALRKDWCLRRLSAMVLWMAVLFGGTTIAVAQNQVMGELEFEGKTKLER